MQRAQFGRRTYVSALARNGGPGGGEGGPGPGGGGGDIAEGLGAEARNLTVQERRERAQREGRDLQRESSNKKFFYQQKLYLEGKRKQLGKGNIGTFLMENAKQGIEPDEVNKLLRIGGFTPDQTVTIKLNDFRPNQVEVLFKPGVQFDTSVVEEKLRRGGIDAIVSKFDHIEDFLMIYGLPPTVDIEVMKLKISEAVSPFVKKVLEVFPCVHKGVRKDDFFDGKMDGNWRLKVVPKGKVQVPNFIVIGNESQVMGKAVYTKKIGEKEEMCADCFRTGHYKKDCPGARNWLEYCKEFKDLWDDLTLEECQDDEAETPPGDEDSRLHVLNKNLLKDMQKVENEKDEAVNKLKEQVNLRERIEELEQNVEELGRDKEESEVRINEVKEALLSKEQELANKNVQPDEFNEKIEEKNKCIKDLEAQVMSNQMVRGDIEKLKDDYKETMEENTRLRSNLEAVQKEKEDLKKKKSMDEAELKAMHRRLSKSYHTEEVALNSQVAEEMFNEDVIITGSPDLVNQLRKENMSQASGGSDPMHGFSSVDTAGSIASSRDHEQVVQSVQEDVNEYEKRKLNSPTEEGCKKVMRRSNHPPIDSKIWIENENGKEIFKVIVKSSSRKSDYKYTLEDARGKRNSVQLEGSSWGPVEDH